MGPVLRLERHLQSGVAHRQRCLQQESQSYRKPVGLADCSLNGNKNVPHSRDGTEVDFQAGLQTLKVFETMPMQTCLLDDIEFYEEREREGLASKQKVYDKYF